jgi:hypothetical protein
MSLEIGPTPIQRSSPRIPAASLSPAAAPSFEATLQSVVPVTPPAPVRVDRVTLGIPGQPPEAVRDAVGVAADRADALADAGRELHFESDEATGRVIVEVRDRATGEVIRTIPPAEALDFLSGGPLRV